MIQSRLQRRALETSWVAWNNDTLDCTPLSMTVSAHRRPPCGGEGRGVGGQHETASRFTAQHPVTPPVWERTGVIVCWRQFHCHTITLRSLLTDNSFRYLP